MLLNVQIFRELSVRSEGIESGPGQTEPPYEGSYLLNYPGQLKGVTLGMWSSD